MPGLVGLITKAPREQAERELRKMVASLCHESFYSTGTYIDERSGVYAGWIAQSGSFADGMPLRNEKGDVALLFAGQEYPDPATSQQLKARGHSFESGDASYLVHLYEDGPNFPFGLNGMFHGLVVDQRQGTVTLFNDRYGMHRLYYSESKDAFYFAAEAKAILAVRPELRVPDTKSLGEFVAYSCVLEDRTIFAGVRAVPGGSKWVFRNGLLENKTSYFQPIQWEQQEPLEAEAYYRELRDVFVQNLPRYFTSRQPLGMTLTGGLDTRAIMAWHKSPPGSLPCYTFGGTRRDTEDVRIARKIATLCGQSHQVITVGDEFLAEFPRYAERSVFLTEGGVDLYRASDLYVSEQARQIAPVKVVGTYGSEIIRHDVMLSPAQVGSGLYCEDFRKHIDQAGQTYERFRHENPVTFAAFRQSPWYHYGILSLEQTQLNVRSPYLDNDFVRTVYRSPRPEQSAGDVRLRLIHEGDAQLGAIRTDRGVNGNSNRLTAGAMRRLLEFSVRAEYAYDYGMPQWLARIDRHLAPLHLERLFLGRHKLSHYRIWYRDQLASYVREILLDSRTLARPYLDRRGVQAMVEGHTRGTQNHTSQIHKLLTLEHLHRLFFDDRAPQLSSDAGRGLRLQ
jgi:asparagine synthase (glutamine-hydrolysing)